MKASIQWFLEALFPLKCLVCKKEGAFLCEKHKHFVPAPPNEADLQYLDEIVAATKYYSTPSRQVVEFFKFRGFKDLSKIMSEEMLKVSDAKNDFFGNSILVPIPLHWSRKFWRGFNQAYILASELQKNKIEISISTDLKRIKRTAQQAKMTRNERIENLKNAFVWTGKTIPQRVILIDDVVASGQTLEEAAKVLKKIGVKEVAAIVFARGGKS